METLTLTPVYALLNPKEGFACSNKEIRNVLVKDLTVEELQQLAGILFHGSTDAAKALLVLEDRYEEVYKISV